MSYPQINDIITIPIKTRQPIDNYDRQFNIRPSNITLNKYNTGSRVVNNGKSNNLKKPAYKKFPSYLYDVKHHNLKIVKKHWKPY